jgi:hypothetical protein
MMGRWVGLTLALAVMAGPAAAHEGHSHASKLMGTVKAVHADDGRVELTTKDGKTTDFYVSAQTKYMKGSAAASLADVKAGARIVVDTKVEGPKTMATMVKLAPDPGKKAAAPGH